MSKAILEHINMTVTDPDKTAGMLADLFGWKVRWSGDSIHNGRSVHVGNEDDYVALYSVGAPRALSENENYRLAGAVNHLGILVDDLDAVELIAVNGRVDPNDRSVVSSVEDSDRHRHLFARD